MMVALLAVLEMVRMQAVILVQSGTLRGDRPAQAQNVRRGISPGPKPCRKSKSNICKFVSCVCARAKSKFSSG